MFCAKCLRASLLSLAVLTVVLAGVASATVFTENFNSDPGWTGNNNTSWQTNDYGFSNTNNAGGTAGEAGGTIMSRTNEFTWYLNDNLGGTFGLSNPLSASGRFTANSTNFDGALEVGFFNTVDPVAVGNVPYHGDGGILEGIAMRFQDSDSSHVRLGPRIGTNVAAGSSNLVLSINTQYLYHLTYDPTGENATTGKATLEVRLAADNSLVGTSTTWYTNEETWALNSYGLSTCNFGTNLAGPQVYLDNLSLEITPEPSAMVLLVTATVGLLAYAWRKRR